MELSKILNEGVSALRQRPASWSRELNRLRGFSEIILGENSGGCTSSNSIDLKTYNYNDKDFNSTEDKKDYLQSNKTIKKIVSNEQDLRNQNEMVSAGWVPSCNYYIENNKSVSNFQRKRLLFYHENLGDNEATRKRFKIPGEVEVYEESEASEGLIDEEMPDEGGLSEKNTLDECFDKSCSGIEKLPSTLETESEYEFESESLSSPSDSNDADDCNTSVSSTTYEVEKNEVFHRFGYDKLVSSFQQRKINNEIDDQSNKRKAIIKQRKDEQIFLSKLENEKANWVKPKELKKIGKYPPIYSSVCKI
ncbi:expressed protein [Phakopsora pachyrhizi]|uniref:Expressed protein n=1 Tax=Phakopsora pachyrhizi TaxID=170000 RepID=A0AAV0BGE2_PHAPC|nr:expressed protein [Phakopsora pachyrhizi]